MTNEFFDLLSMWQADRTSRRTVNIHLGEVGRLDDYYAFVYDIDLGCGSRVTTIEELENLDLKKEARERAQRELERLS